MNSYTCCSTISPQSLNIEKAAQMLKILAEPNRLRILCVLNNENEHCVCEFKDHMPDVSQSLLSHHLADLKKAGLVHSDKRSQRVYYTLSESGRHTMKHVLKLTKEDAI